MVDGPCVVDATLSRWATLGKGVWSLLDAAVGALLLFDADGRAVAGEIDSFQQSNRYLLPDGGTVWGLLTMTIVRDANGTPQHFVAQIQDITSRKTTEGGLRRYTAQLNTLSGQDPLTGLSNQRACEAALEVWLSLLAMGGSPCSILLVGVHGDDAAISAAAGSLTAASRDTDLVAYLGAGDGDLRFSHDSAVPGASVRDFMSFSAPRPPDLPATRGCSPAGTRARRNLAAAGACRRPAGDAGLVLESTGGRRSRLRRLCR